MDGVENVEKPGEIRCEIDKIIAIFFVAKIERQQRFEGIYCRKNKIRAKSQPLKLTLQWNGSILANTATTACLCLQCTKTRTQKPTNGCYIAYLDVLLRVLQVFKERFVSPSNSRLFVGT